MRHEFVLARYCNALDEAIMEAAKLSVDRIDILLAGNVHLAFGTPYFRRTSDAKWRRLFDLTVSDTQLPLSQVQSGPQT